MHIRLLCCWQLTHIALLLQERWLQGDARLQGLLKALPIFEAANAADAQKPAFSDLHELTLAAPERMPAAALEDTFIAASIPGQRAALSCLGVEMLSHSTVIRYAAHPPCPSSAAVLRCLACCLATCLPPYKGCKRLGSSKRSVMSTKSCRISETHQCHMPHAGSIS